MVKILATIAMLFASLAALGGTNNAHEVASVKIAMSQILHKPYSFGPTAISGKFAIQSWSMPPNEAGEGLLERDSHGHWKAVTGGGGFWGDAATLSGYLVTLGLSTSEANKEAISLCAVYRAKLRKMPQMRSELEYHKNYC